MNLFQESNTANIPWPVALKTIIFALVLRPSNSSSINLQITSVVLSQMTPPGSVRPDY